MTGERAVVHHAQELLAKMFKQPSPQRHPLVLVVDEVVLCDIDVYSTRHYNQSFC